MVLWTSPVAAAGAASLCGILFWSGVCASGFFWSVLGSCSGAFAGLPWSGAVEGCWSGVDGCDVELGAVLGAVLGEAGVLCAIAKPLPNATINASLLKFLTIVLRFPFSRFGPLGNRYAYTKDERRSSRNRGHFGCYSLD